VVHAADRDEAKAAVEGVFRRDRPQVLSRLATLDMRLNAPRWGS
jgi:hypothetical protein